jgi:hypothetical protein
LVAQSWELDDEVEALAAVTAVFFRLVCTWLGRRQVVVARSAL